MDVSYNLVAAKCSAQMASYQNCVQKNQDKAWSELCANESEALTKCADQNVPQLKVLKTTCADSIKAYAGCMTSHGHGPDEEVAAECQGVMRDLWKCTEGVVGKG